MRIDKFLKGRSPKNRDRHSTAKNLAGEILAKAFREKGKVSSLRVDWKLIVGISGMWVKFNSRWQTLGRKDLLDGEMGPETRAQPTKWMVLTAAVG